MTAVQSDIETFTANEGKVIGEWETRIQLAMGVMDLISEEAGNELPIYPIDENSVSFDKPGLFILEDEAGKAENIMGTRFELIPTLLSGAADSYHAVLGGRLHIELEDGGPKDLLVAAKVFAKRTMEEKKERTIREISTMKLLRSNGVLSLVPIAVAVLPENVQESGKIVLVTEYDMSLLTLDNQPWGRGITPENFDSASKAIMALAEFNTLGRRHGDAKIKNVALDEINGRVSMIDYETTTEFDIENPSELTETVYLDFGKLIESLFAKRFLRDDSESFEAINILADIYLGSWVTKDVATQTAVADGLISAIENFKISSTA